MNKPLIGIGAFCTLATVAGFLASRRNAPMDDQIRRAPANAVVAAPIHANPAREFLPESDTTGLLQESLPVDDLLDGIDFDSGDEFTPIDRERLAVELRESLGH